jgi:hypothetical protein
MQFIIGGESFYVGMLSEFVLGREFTIFAKNGLDFMSAIVGSHLS